MNNRFVLKAAALVVAIIAVAAATVAIVYLRHAAIHRQVDFTGSLSHSIANNTAGSLGNIDYVLQVSADEIQHQISTRQLTFASVTAFLSKQQD